MGEAETPLTRSARHTGESRYPVLISRFARLDSGVRRNDEGGIFWPKSIDKGESLG
jgi:hypothetical protein